MSVPLRTEMLKDGSAHLKVFFPVAFERKFGRKERSWRPAEQINGQSSLEALVQRHIVRLQCPGKQL